MKEYYVVPNKDESGWFVKIEDVAPTSLFNGQSEAIAEAEKLAKENQPAKVLVENENNEIVSEKTFS
ncbi:DUF2188 domain-containing protein [Rossellomorea vietnamensis]|jgi:hypothetical protein|uniref:DUF2188 domain-containing protein n=2 Tax=Rossellomorea TaxID=2837508 RepID=A0A5D4K9F8_9BACI|nr:MULTISPECIES: DUF2188 domain-containing protein [Rossellomorea]TYR74021.1 DUF2188 domain-containing protein [Rossellomorea vietnamensis]TYS18684.1 DUF2188 domain-containing protein [Rossellomorea vietnamensis]TYS82823.1 DUF2188 domain-containing protein [Rossellomorea aquimaris]